MAMGEANTTTGGSCEKEWWLNWYPAFGVRFQKPVAGI